MFGLGSLTDVNSSTPGVVNVFELSFDDPVDLDALQSDVFTLFTVNLRVLDFGDHNLSLEVLDLGDADGALLTAQTSEANIAVAPPVAVPAPATLSLWLAGMAWVVIGGGVITWFRQRSRP